MSRTQDKVYHERQLFKGEPFTPLSQAQKIKAVEKFFSIYLAHNSGVSIAKLAMQWSLPKGWIEQIICDVDRKISSWDVEHPAITLHNARRQAEIDNYVPKKNAQLERAVH